jgi:ATP-dependent DNA helicase RecG
MNFFFAKIEKLLSLKEHTQKALNRLKIYNARDMLFHLPSHYLVRNINPNLSKIFHDEHIIAEVKIEEIQISQRKFGPHKIFVSNETGFIELVFFNVIPSFVYSQIKINHKIIIEGKIKKIGGNLQINHPDFIFNKDLITKFEPVYPLTYGIQNKQIYSFILKILNMLPDINNISYEDNNISFKQALFNIHKPLTIDNIESIRKMAFLEFFCNQCLLYKTRKNNQVKRDYNIIIEEEIQNKILKNLGFTLTSCQNNALKDIRKDFISEFRMIRMIQGDVGSGKTMIALFSIIDVVKSGKQATFMAPTDLLANQHFQLFSKMLQEFGIKVEILTGSTKSKERKKILEDLQSGEIKILIGTHALFQEKVEYHDLKYIVIDEQHRFGVEQRIELINKSNNADLLVMTATPIPRSLTLTIFGDMPVSRIETKPEGRIPIITSSIPKSKINDLISSIQYKINNKEKIFWICPLIEENEENKDSEKQIYSNINSRSKILEEIFPDKVLMLHGKLKQKDKDQKMIDFKEGEYSILVSTTVIEVGIDIQQATLIVIENVEKFGLAQIHQLRGRVGRGKQQSYCVLLYGDRLSDNARKRIAILKKSSDGFLIAEEDLMLRGAGDILGIKQSGEESFYFAELYRDRDLLLKAHKIVNSHIIEECENLNKFINIFNKDKINFLGSG